MAFCAKCQSDIKKLWKKVDDLLIENLGLALNITNTLKELVNNPIVKTIADLTPTQIDNLILGEAGKFLTNAAIKLNMLSIVINPKTDEERKEAIMDIVAILKNLTSEHRDAFLFKLGSLITKLYDNGRFNNHMYDLAQQVNFSLKKLSQ